MKYKIRLDTSTDVAKFVALTTSIQNAEITVTDGKGMCVNARSLLGMLYALEFTELWCNSNVEIYDLIKDFVI